jgi:hypothetical protein
VTSTRPDPRTPHSRVQVCRTAIARPRTGRSRRRSGAPSQLSSPLLIPPLHQLAQLRAARAHGENAENAQEEAAQGLRMLGSKENHGSNHEILGSPLRGARSRPNTSSRPGHAPASALADHPMHLWTVVGPRVTLGIPSYKLLCPTTRKSSARPQSANSSTGPPRVSQLIRAHHGLLNVQSIQQGENDSGLDFLELPMDSVVLVHQHHAIHGQFVCAPF